MHFFLQYIYIYIYIDMHLNLIKKFNKKLYQNFAIIYNIGLYFWANIKWTFFLLLFHSSFEFS